MIDTMIPSAVLIGILVLILGFLRLRHVSIQGLTLGITGAILGLVLSALAAVPLGKLPSPWGGILPSVVTGVLTIAMVVLVVARRAAIAAALPPFFGGSHHADGKHHNAAPAGDSTLPPILVDTSVIIDGRIADIATAGFVPGRLVVPRFVLAELQNIADSDDAMRRGRGRRGLDVLNRLREMPDVEVTIIEDDVQGVKEVDAKLVALAQRFSCNVLTTDYNLNRVAQIQGVRVLNVNELSNAIRPVVLPGEELIVRVVQPGKERNQGVGYLADGTMIVVEDGDKLMGQEVPTEVTRVFQTVAGKMIFAVPRPGVLAAGKSSGKKFSNTDAADYNPATVPSPRVDLPREPEVNPLTSASSTSGSNQNSGSGRSRRSGRGRGGSKYTSPNTDRPSSPSAIENRIISATQPDQPGRPQHPARPDRRQPK